MEQDNEVILIPPVSKQSRIFRRHKKKIILFFSLVAFSAGAVFFEGYNAVSPWINKASGYFQSVTYGQDEVRSLDLRSRF